MCRCQALIDLDPQFGRPRGIRPIGEVLKVWPTGTRVARERDPPTNGARRAVTDTCGDAFRGNGSVMQNRERRVACRHAP